MATMMNCGKVGGFRCSQSPSPVARSAPIRSTSSTSIFAQAPLANGPFKSSPAHISASRRSSSLARRAASTVCAAKPHKVALLGSAGGIGQPLALLLKMQPYVSELALYDIANVVGVAADLSHCNTPVKVTGHTGAESLGEALRGSDVVVIPAGVPRKPGMTRDDLFNINASIVKTLAEGVAKHSPNAVVAIISNPVNSTVPIAAEVFKAAGTYDPKKLLGVTTLDVVRANTFVAEAKGLDVQDVDVPVVGGHAGTTILPILSQASPKVDFSVDEAAKMTDKIQNAGTEVVEAKAGAGSATLSMAYAAARMTESILRGLDGEQGIYEAAYVESNVTELPFFASKVRLGPSGVEEIQGLGQLNEAEQKGVQDLIPVLRGNIEKGVGFAKNPPKK